MVRVIIAGTRNFSDYPLMKDKLDRLRASIGVFEVVDRKSVV